jgi:hypothetical protein
MSETPPNRPLEFNSPEEIMAEILRVRLQESFFAFMCRTEEYQERQALRLQLYRMLLIAVNERLEAEK